VSSEFSGCAHEGSDFTYEFEQLEPARMQDATLGEKKRKLKLLEDNFEQLQN
jgi:hypothetical protein